MLMALLKQIPINELEINTWYVGRGRRGNVGLWTGRCFLVIANKSGSNDSQDNFVIKKEPYFTEEMGCFQPFKSVSEGVVTQLLPGVDGVYGYAETMLF